MFGRSAPFGTEALRLVNASRYLLGFVIAITLAYQLAVVWITVHGALAFYYAHLGLILTIVILSLTVDYLDHRDPRLRVGVIALLMAVLIATLLSAGYLHLTVDEIELRQPFITRTDFIAGAALIGSVLLLTVPVWGWVLTGVIALAIAYFAFGDLLPGSLHYDPPGAEIVMSYLAGMGGARGILWGIPLSANTLFLIIVYGGLLKGTRILELFNEAGKLLVNVTRGGVCYSSVFASSTIGMVTGQAVANIALAGSVTIPAMRQRGLSGEQAGAVEVVASLGSQIIPPIMGLSAFLIAVELGIPYVEVAAAAVIPAFLFVATVVIAIYFLTEASPDLITDRETVELRRIFWMLPSFLASFGALVALLYLRYSPSYAAFWAIGLLLALSFARPASYRPTLTDLASGIVYGSIAAAKLGLILAGIGIVVQVLVTTGAGFSLGRFIMQAAGGSIALGLVFGMVLALLVGMGLPTPAAYALIAIIMIPFLIDLGVVPLVAHFFGFYFAIFSAVTPPVAVGILTASRISGASFYGTAREALRISFICILIPYAFVAFPSLLDFPQVTVEALIVSVVLLLSTAMWGASVYGVLIRPLRRSERLVMLLGPASFLAMLLLGNLWLGLVPVALFLVVLLGVKRHTARAGEMRVGDD